ncbi:MAG: biotin--[acetyl-CoA-carboxylase] ligase [Kiritimatiellae bacterium]|nr:biotin--[acetyl-CoA-carboxylase] ligase [Kiritimatiellia bacterium]MCO5067623.1 biotin--[acetyl-CoA-carboxylase] ligase [Kiritimatiellia bacterium]
MDPELDKQRLPNWAFALRAGLETESIGQPVLAFDEVGSTNDVAKQMALQNAPDGLAVVARNQTGGRGRRGRTWASFPGQAVYLSVLLRPPAWPPGEVSWLGVLGGVAAANALHELGVKNLRIKWPNDVLIEGRKIGGILVEPRLGEGALAFAVLGIGINVQQEHSSWPADLQAIATSCAIEGVAVSCDEVIRATLLWIDRWYSRLLKGERQTLMDDWSRWGGTDQMPVLD